jgi:VanZ family protein
VLCVATFAIVFYDKTMKRKYILIMAWMAFAAIVFITVSPIELRPYDVAPVNFDRAAAFAVMTMLFILAYPRKWLLCAILLIGGAGGIELLQFLSPTRHAEVDDALVKALGAGVGTLMGLTLNQLRSRAQSQMVRS